MKTLTVKKLKGLLDSLDENLLVVRNDNSGGYEAIDSLQVIPIKNNFDKDAKAMNAVVIN